MNDQVLKVMDRYKEAVSTQGSSDQGKVYCTCIRKRCIRFTVDLLQENWNLQTTTLGVVVQNGRRMIMDLEITIINCDVKT